MRQIPLEVGLRGRTETLYGETVDEARLVGKEVKIPFQASDLRFYAVLGYFRMF